MKIIGKTKDGFILEATKDDVAGLAGLYYTYETQFDVGDIIDIEGLHSKYVSVAIALKDISDLKKSAQRLIDAANWVDKFRQS